MNFKLLEAALIEAQAQADKANAQKDDVQKVKAMEKLSRTMWSQFRSGKLWRTNKDLYKSPRGFLSWNECVSSRLFASDAKTEDILYDCQDKAGMMVAKMCSMTLHENTPVRYISNELLESFQKTPRPELTDEILDIYPHFLLMLPEGSLITDDKSDVKYMIVQTGQIHPTLSKEERAELERRFGRSVILDKKFEGARGIAVSAVTAYCNYTWLQYMKPELNALKHNSDCSADAKSTLEGISRIAVSSLLTHLYEPDLITTEQAHRSSVGFAGKGKAHRTLPVTWIGKNFKRSESRAAGPSTPTGRTQRTHWRRGHWHTIVCGKGRQERQMRWFRPMLVNANG
jgi:hypothetical protein